jgi:hypothetical protein
MQMETKKIPTKTQQTISLNKALLSLSIYFPLSFLSFSYLISLLLYQRHDIDLFFVVQGPSYMGLKAMMLPEPYFPLIILFSHSFLIKTKTYYGAIHLSTATFVQSFLALQMKAVSLFLP